MISALCAVQERTAWLAGSLFTDYDMMRCVKDSLHLCHSFCLCVGFASLSTCFASMLWFGFYLFGCLISRFSDLMCLCNSFLSPFSQQTQFLILHHVKIGMQTTTAVLHSSRVLNHRVNCWTPCSSRESSNLFIETKHKVLIVQDKYCISNYNIRNNTINTLH